MPNSFRSFITKPPSTARDGWNLCLYRLLPLPHLSWKSLKVPLWGSSSDHSCRHHPEASASSMCALQEHILACLKQYYVILVYIWASTIFSYRIRCLMRYWRSILSFSWDLSGGIKSWEHGSFSSTQAIAFPVSTEHLMYLSTLNFLNIHCLLNKNQPGKKVFIFLGDLDPSCLRCSWNHWSLQLEGLTKNLATRVQPKSQAMLKILYI